MVSERHGVTCHLPDSTMQGKHRGNSQFAVRPNVNKSPVVRDDQMTDDDLSGKQVGVTSIDPRPEASQAPAEATRVIHSVELFAGRRTVVIQHADVQYRLLITRNDRLILQK